MALVKCPDCGKMISNHAEYCIECGCPMSYILGKMDKNDNADIENKYYNSNDNDKENYIRCNNFDEDEYEDCDEDEDENYIEDGEPYIGSDYYGEDNYDSYSCDEEREYYNEMNDIYSEYAENYDNSVNEDWYYSDDD